MEINRILLDLEVIKQIKEDDKLGVIISPGEKKIFVDSSNKLSSITRWYKGYDRVTTILYLEDLVEKIDKVSNFIKTGKHKNMANLLIKAINSCIDGLHNLKSTYENDSITIAKLILIINKLKDISMSLYNIDYNMDYNFIYDNSDININNK
jgi:hypothetical protein